MPNRDTFDPFAPPVENGDGAYRSTFAMAFDENEDSQHSSNEPREPWEPRDNPDHHARSQRPRDTPESRNLAEPTDTPPGALPDQHPSDRQLADGPAAGGAPTDQRPSEPADEPADLDPFDVRDDDAVVSSEHTASTPSVATATGSTTTGATPSGSVAAPVLSAEPAGTAGATVAPTASHSESEPTDSPPWEREPRVLDGTTFSDVSDVKDTPAPERANGFSPNRTDGSDETTFMSTVDEPVQTGPSEEEQLEAARKRHVEELQQRWLITQAQLLDDPRDAVREAGLLIGDAMQFVTTTFTEHRDRIEREWKDNAEMNTDELRAIMRRYRNLFQYVLSASQLPDL